MPLDNLIFDLGLNNGRDTEFYLGKGFQVVAIEANPVLYREASAKFEKEISAGRLILLNLGVWNEANKLTFYINLANDHWSSFDPAYGCRDNTPFETTKIDCITISGLLQMYGTPRYLKIDIEGADKHVLSALREEEKLPTFISVEEYGVQAIDDLANLGYTHFKVVPQDRKNQTPPKPPREGSYFEREFNGTDSGLFGQELPGEWLPLEVTRRKYITSIRREDRTYIGPPGEWFDIHATRI